MMRIDLSFKDFQSGAESHRTLDLVATYVNDRIGERYYGPGLLWIDVSVCSHTKPEKKLRRNRKYPNSFAEHVLFEVRAEFGPEKPRSLQDFQTGLQLIGKCVEDSRDCWQGEFRLAEFQRDFEEIERSAPQTDDELKAFAKQASNLKQKLRLKWQRTDELHRFHNPRPLSKNLAGMRCCPSGRLERALEPYASRYCGLFEGLLRYAKWKTPGYQEIYFNIDETDELARLNPSALEEWHEDAFAVVPLEEFEAADHAGKCSLVFGAFCRALRELAEIDHLDRDILEGVIRSIEESGFDTDLVYLELVKPEHVARILYRLSPDQQPTVYRLQVVRTATGEVVERPLDVRPEEELYLPHRFGKLELTKKEVRIRARSGERARITLKHHKRPERIIFSLAELFGE